jgi:hypothetical protein
VEHERNNRFMVHERDDNRLPHGMKVNVLKTTDIDTVHPVGDHEQHYPLPDVPNIPNPGDLHQARYNPSP